jgi:hypothetical protein
MDPLAATIDQGPGDNYISGAMRTVTTPFAVLLAVIFAVAFGGHLA